MTFKAVLFRWVVCAVALYSLAELDRYVDLNSDEIAASMAPPYMEPAEETVYAQAHIPCMRPPGASSGCAFPKKDIPPPSGDAINDMLIAQSIDSHDESITLRLYSARLRLATPYQEREIAPRVEKLETWTRAGVTVGIGCVLLYAFLVLRRWYRVRGTQILQVAAQKVAQGAAIVPDFKGRSASRELQRAEADFTALKNLFDNGLISEETFNLRKAELRAAIEKQNRPA